MLDVNNIFLFLFIFSLLGVIRVILMILVSLFRTPPTKVVLSIRETIFFGIFLSYVLTYIFK
jgi:hypothetical protein